MLHSIILLPLLLVGAASATKDGEEGEAALQKVLSGRVATSDVRGCLSPRLLGASEVIDGTAIIYRGNGSRVWVNRPRVGADDLENNVILINRTPSSNLCRGDAVDLVRRSSGDPAGFVELGDFVAYDRVK